MSSANHKSQAAGGVLIDEYGRVLLRRPKNGYGDYAWTYPKGRVDAGETVEQAALREVLEESGWEAEIVKQIQGPGPNGDFEGDTTVTRFFLMRPLCEVADFGRKETEAVAWATPDGARRMIKETTSGQGRARDLAVLEGALGVVA
jgi:8-oxo-dGTP pyrophosphatase MutT (NUDIX family)